MTNNTKAISFWNFLKENTIEIPIIQRDYAQGRLGKENLRKTFLGDLKRALKDNIEMKLDFVYGSVEGGTLNPLDGQQRLTTLWLQHWYIALRAGVLNEENCKIFQRFTYETRISSREFCENLCNPKHFEEFDGNEIVGFITKQTWFYSAWKQDPTIQSMLRMLGGTKINDKNGDDIIDGIEELFDCPSECDIIKNTKCLLLRDFQNYWNKVTSDDCPIVFYHLPLQDFGLSDDLYIKMNARGKQLTSFENFKADLIGYITKQSKNKQVLQAEWQELLDPESGIPIKLDTDWTDIFWKNKSEDNKIDDIYFAFINRYFLQELICAKKEDNTDIYSADDLEKNNGSFRYLYGDKGDDSRLKYSGLDKYILNDDKVIPLSFFTSFRNTLNSFKSDSTGCMFFGGCCLNAHFPDWVDSKFEFIPKYDETGNITTLGQKERIVFLAISRYLEMGDFDSVSFKQWIRVVWNIVENSGIETIPAMIGSMRLINELSINSHRINDFLAHVNYDEEIKSKAAEKQVREEIAKAKQIVSKTFTENDIRDAEKHPLLKGCISTLFEDDNCERVSFGQSIQERINLLDRLWNKDNEKDYTLVKVLISLYNEEKPEEKLYLKKNLDNWKSLVTDKLKKCFRKNKDNSIYTGCKDWQYLLSNTNLIENSRETGKIVKSYGNKVVLWGTSGCSWNAYGNVILDELHCNSVFLQMIKDKIVESNQKIDGCDFLWGWHIDFEYEHNAFQWNNDDNKIYLIEDGKYKEPKEKYCFNSEGLANVDMFVKRLKFLLESLSTNQ